MKFLKSLFSLLPLPATEPLPRLVPQDRALADEAPITEAEIEACLTQIRTVKPRAPAATDFFVAIGQAEKFAFDCLEFGSEQTHQTKASHMRTAFGVWSLQEMVHQIEPRIAAEAIETVLQWRGGFKLIRENQELYVGCRLNQRAVDRVNATHRTPHIVYSVEKVTRELLG